MAADQLEGADAAAEVPCVHRRLPRAIGSRALPLAGAARADDRPGRHTGARPRGCRPPLHIERQAVREGLHRVIVLALVRETGAVDCGQGGGVGG